MKNKGFIGVGTREEPSYYVVQISKPAKEVPFLPHKGKEGRSGEGKKKKKKKKKLNSLV